MTVIYAVLIFCVLIFVHELGHFAVAKKCGIKVNEFAIGMGPVIFQRQRGETMYCVRIFPIGGFCAMEGEDEESSDKRAFNNKPAQQKALVLVAGSAMNFVTCVILMIIVSLVMGTATTTIGAVSKGFPAEAAGIEAGDRLLSIDGKEIESWNDVTLYVPQKKTSDIAVVIQRDGQLKELQVANEYSKESKRYILGVTTKVSHNPGKAVINGISGTGNLTVLMYKIIKMIFTGEVSTKDLSGPVGIVYAVNDSAKQGIINVMYLAALLSLNLAVINMLPFPALDGGRVLFLAIRKVTGNAISDKIEGMIHMAGMLCLLGLMVYVTYNDVLRFIIPLFS